MYASVICGRVGISDCVDPENDIYIVDFFLFENWFVLYTHLMCLCVIVCNL